jgi:hypothetical protein
MTGEGKMVEALPKAFWIALLLTGSIEAAEAAVLDGIAALEFDHISSDRLLLATAKSAIQRRTEFLEQSEGLSILPLELHEESFRKCDPYVKLNYAAMQTSAAVNRKAV